MAKTKSLFSEIRDFVGAMFSLPGDFLALGMGMPPSEAGMLVTEMTAMQVGAVAACLRIISTAVSTLPLYIYERMPNGGARLAVEHPLFELLSTQPSPDYPAVDFFSAAMMHILQTGNSYAEILENGAGQPAELCLRSPFRTFAYRDTKSGLIVYKTSDTYNGAERLIPAENMLHFKGLGLDPFTGLSPIKFFAREIIGTALAAQAYGARLFKNDARPGGYLSTDKVLKPLDKLEQVKRWREGHSGNNSHSIAILDGGAKWNTVGIPPEEAQFLQTRQFQRSEIASIFGVPAHMLGDPQETKATIEQKSLEFLIWTVKPWLRKIEQACNSKLFPKTGRTAGKFFAKYDVSEYEQPDYATKLKALQTGRYAGILSIDEGRAKVGLNPSTKDNFDVTQPGKVLMMPVNMFVMTDNPPTLAPGDDPTTFDEDPAKPSTGKDPNADGTEPGTTDEPGASDADDSRSFRHLYPVFADALGRLKSRKEASYDVWQRTLGPSLYSVAAACLPLDRAGEPLPEPLAQGVALSIANLQVRGREDVAMHAETIFKELTSAIVRAAKSHVLTNGGQ